MDEELEKIMAGCLAHEERMRAYDAGIEAVLREKSGGRLLRRDEEDERYLTRRQCAWGELRYFYNAALVGSADLFGYLELIDRERAAFEEIGAVKTLAAADSLRELRAEYEAAEEAEQPKLWKKMRPACDAAFEEADGMEGFAELLIRHAEAHPEEFPLGEVAPTFEEMVKAHKVDPFAAMSAEEKATEVEKFMRDLEITGGLEQLAAMQGVEVEEFKRSFREDMEKG